MAQSVIGALRVNLGLDSAKFTSGARRARSTSQQLAADMQRIALAAAAVGAAIVGMARNAMVTIDSQAKLARAVGGTTIGLQALQRAGDRAGVQQSELAAATTRLNQTLGQAITEGKATSGVFGRLGLDARRLAQMDIDERFAAIADAMRDANMSTQEQSFALRQLGIRQASVITLIQQGSDEIARSRQAVIDYGVAVSEIDASKIERANDALSEVGRVFEGLRNQIAIALAPQMEALATAFTDAARAGGVVYNVIRGFVAQVPRLTTYISTAVGAFVAFRAVILGVAAAKWAAAAAAGGLRVALMRLGLPIIILGIGEVAYQLSRLTRATGGWGEALTLLGEIAAGVWDGIKTSAEAIPAALNAVWNRMKEGFLSGVAAMAYAWADFVSLVARSAERLGQIEFLGSRPFSGMAGTINNAATNALEAANDIMEASMAAGAQAREAERRATAAVTEGYDKARDALARLNDVMKSNTSDTNEAADAARDLTNALDEMAGGGGGGGGRAGGVVAEAIDAFEQLGQTMQDALTRGFMSIFDGTKRAVDAFRDMARQIISELFRVLVVQRLVGSFQPGGGGILGALAGGIGRNANGTDNWRGGLTMVGERGPELVSLPRGSQVVDAQRTARLMQDGGGDVIQNFTFNLAANGDESVQRIVMQAAPRIVEAAKQGVLDARRRGGSYRAAFG